MSVLNASNYHNSYLNRILRWRQHLVWQLYQMKLQVGTLLIRPPKKEKQNKTKTKNQKQCFNQVSWNLRWFFNCQLGHWYLKWLTTLTDWNLIERSCYNQWNHHITGLISITIAKHAYLFLLLIDFECFKFWLRGKYLIHMNTYCSSLYKFKDYGSNIV